MENSDKLSYYERNKDKILENVKSEKLDNKKYLLSKRGFAENLASWARINTESISLQFSTPDELVSLLLTENIRKDRLNDIESDKNEIFILLKSKKLRNKKDLLSRKNFPDIIAPWARVNKESVSLTFSNPEEFDKFLSIKDDILIFCQHNIIDNVEITNSNVNT